MNDTELLRYSRHILMDEWGIDAQARVKAAHVLIIGAGGLGCPAALYLAASGVGTLTLADPDHIDLTNLQRQIAYDTADIGKPKASALADKLLRSNPHVNVFTRIEKLEAAALLDAVSAANLVLDCTDNFSARQAINAACVQTHTPLVSGAAIRFDGQVSVFDSRDAASPCYACLYPADQPPLETACAELGVFAPLVGLIGSLQAAEALKIIANIDGAETLTGRLLTVDARTMAMTTLRVKRDADCRVCSTPHQ